MTILTVETSNARWIIDTEAKHLTRLSEEPIRSGTGASIPEYIVNQAPYKKVEIQDVGGSLKALMEDGYYLISTEIKSIKTGEQ